jgi:hypothetical protein
VITAGAPSAQEVIDRLGYDGIERTLLAESECGPFKFLIVRVDSRDGDEPVAYPPEIEFSTGDLEDDAGVNGHIIVPADCLPQLVQAANEIASDWTEVTR